MSGMHEWTRKSEINGSHEHVQQRYLSLSIKNFTKLLNTFLFTSSVGRGFIEFIDFKPLNIFLINRL